MEETNENLSAEEKRLRTLFYLSYQHSQGDNQLQLHLFEWIAKKGGFTKVPKDPPPYIQNLPLPGGHRSVNLIGDVSLSLIFGEDWQHLAMEINSKDESLIKPDSLLLDLILKKCLARDLRYQTEVFRGKDQTGKKAHKSFLREHAILDKPAGDTLYNDLYHRLGERARKHLADETEIGQTFKELIFLWEESHPQEKFFPKNEK